MWLAIVTGGMFASGAAPAQTAETARYEPLIPVGEVMDEGGIYDPSIKYDATGRTGWLVYTAIHKSRKYPGIPVGPYCETHLAQTTDAGRTWRYVKALNSSTLESIRRYNGETMSGLWRYEVPTLVFDPGDPGKEWKLFAHRYFWTQKSDRMPEYGWITYRCAADPAGEWSQETPFFGAGQSPPGAYHTTSIDLNALDPSLKSVIAYTEPGAIRVDGALYLSLTALGAKGPEKIILLGSHNHGASWNYLGTLVDNRDAEFLGYQKFDASSLVQEGKRQFLFVSPESAATLHDGTMIIEFKDISQCLLQREGGQTLAVLKRLRGQPQWVSRFGAGQADYDEHNTYGGIIISQAVMSEAPRVFQIFSTRQMISGP